MTPDRPAAGADDPVAYAERIAAQVAGWSPARWRARPAGGPAATKGELLHGCVQRLADLCARYEDREGRPVPRLANDYALPDQLRVMVADLARAGAFADDRAGVREEALRELTGLHRGLFER